MRKIKNVCAPFRWIPCEYFHSIWNHWKHLLPITGWLNVQKLVVTNFFIPKVHSSVQNFVALPYGVVFRIVCMLKVFSDGLTVSALSIRHCTKVSTVWDNAVDCLVPVVLVFMKWDQEQWRQAVNCTVWDQEQWRQAVNCTVWDQEQWRQAVNCTVWDQEQWRQAVNCTVWDQEQWRQAVNCTVWDQEQWRQAVNCTVSHLHYWFGASILHTLPPLEY